MRKTYVTIPEHADVWELARILSAHNVTGAPVVDKGGNLLGVVSQTDIVRQLNEVLRPDARTQGFYADAEPDNAQQPRAAITAKDLMTTPPIHADEKTPVAELSRIMLAHNIHRIVITCDRKVCGIVTMMDLLKVL